MNTTYHKYHPCIVAITSEDHQGNPHIGTGFHIGDGLIATARHVVEGTRVIKVDGKFNKDVSVKNIFYPESRHVDVAVLETNFDLSYYMNRYHVAGSKWEKIDYLPLAVEWDDFVDDSLILYDAVVMGYPPVPTGFTTLITIRTQVNAVVDQYPFGGESPPPCFILSGIPRGGFSGAPMLMDFKDDSFVMGIVTSALVKNQQPAETGFMAAVTMESLLATLHRHGLYPSSNSLAVKAFASELTPEEEIEFLHGAKD